MFTPEVNYLPYSYSLKMQTDVSLFSLTSSDLTNDGKVQVGEFSVTHITSSK